MKEMMQWLKSTGTISAPSAVISSQTGRTDGDAALEDYLEMIYRLCSRTAMPASAGCQNCFTQAPVTSKMISKRRALTTEYDRYEIIRMTAKGRKRRLSPRRHDTVERFLKLVGCQNLLEETGRRDSLSPNSGAPVPLVFFARTVR
jgi:hypothetical protein